MTPSPETVRVFIALDISPAARQLLTFIMAELQRAIPSGVKWVDPQGVHLTLKFLGNINSGLADGIIQAMTQAGKSATLFRLALDGLGVFPNLDRPRVLWAGTGGDLTSLSALHGSVDELVSALGFPWERQPFRPHVTLGRVREGIAPALRSRISAAFTDTTLPAAEPWLVDAVHLIRSNLGPHGAVYTSMGAARIGRNPNAHSQEHHDILT